MSELIDNSRYRIETLKGIITRLHDGADPEELTAEFGELLAEVGATEIAAMESSLMADGMAQEEIQRMCDVHAAVLGSGLGDEAPEEAGPGHPVHTFRLENRRILEMAESYRALADEAMSRLDAEVVDRLRSVHDELAAVDGHYKRKEYLVFPFLEKAGIAGPPKVMWGVHDEIREKMAAAAELLSGLGALGADERALAVDSVIAPMLEQVTGMTSKEDRILWPMAMAHLSAQDWGEVHRQWSDLGPGLAEPAAAWQPPLPVLPVSPVKLPAEDSIQLPTGHLSLNQLVAVLNTLPVDLTFVDADGRVAYFSEGRDRVFERNRAVIGRTVENCHPPKSVHVVQQVVDDLQSGRRDVAEFWIRMGARFVHIRYFAVRDPAGEYLGVLEVTQDVAPMRALEGERRLLAELPGEGAPA
jgi:DUF438 domain-containing protein